MKGKKLRNIYKKVLKSIYRYDILEIQSMARIAKGIHPFPSRTRKLSPLTSMVLAHFVLGE